MIITNNLFITIYTYVKNHFIYCYNHDSISIFSPAGAGLSPSTSIFSGFGASPSFFGSSFFGYSTLGGGGGDLPIVFLTLSVSSLA